MNKYEEAVAHCYSTWGKTYYDEYYGEKAPYPPVQVDLLRDLLKKHNVRRLLDAGCGPASFLRELVEDDVELNGFDLTPEMVEEGKRVFENFRLSADKIWQGSVLDLNAFKCPSAPEYSFDGVVCSGVLPHISETDEDLVIKNLHDAVEPGGIVALEARNQLFALFTMNRYSYDLIAGDLIQSQELVEKAGEDKETVAQLLEDMKGQFRMDIPPIRKGKEDEPGYDEVLSRTHNPIVLRQKFERQGFTDIRLMFYHYHCLPPMFGSKVSDFFIKESLAMEKPEDWRGYFMASAFFVVGTKR